MLTLTITPGRSGTTETLPNTKSAATSKEKTLTALMVGSLLALETTASTSVSHLAALQANIAGPILLYFNKPHKISFFIP